MANVGVYQVFLAVIVAVLPLQNVVTPVLASIFILLFGLSPGWRSLDSFMNRCWLGLGIWLVITTITAFDPAVAWTGLFNFLPFWLFMAIAQAVIISKKQFAQILQLLIIASLPISLFGMAQVIINQPTWLLPRLFNSYTIGLGMSGDQRITSLFGHFNELGIYLSMILIITLGTWRSQWWRWLVLVLGLVAIIFSGSRSAGALLVLGIIALAIYRRYWYGVGAIALANILLLWAAWGRILGIGGAELRFLFPSALISRLESTINPAQSDFGSTINRLGAWQFALDLIKDRPIQGWGLRSFELIAKSQSFDLQGLPHEHNFFLTLAVAGGLPFMLGFMGLLIYGLGHRGKLDRSNLDGSTKDALFALNLAIAIFYGSGVFDVVFYEPRLNLFSWLLVAMVNCSKEWSEDQYRSPAELDGSQPLP